MSRGSRASNWLLISLLLVAPPSAQAFRAINMFLGLDVCESEAAGLAPGHICRQGTIYVGKVSTLRYMTTPGNCTDSATPICDGGVDTLSKYQGDAAAYCDALTYAGYSDWKLPTAAVLNLMYAHRSAIGGFQTTGYSWYWSSTDNGLSMYYEIYFETGDSDFWNGTFYDRFRCVRSF